MAPTPVLPDPDFNWDKVGSSLSLPSRFHHLTLTRSALPLPPAPPALPALNLYSGELSHNLLSTALADFQNFPRSFNFPSLPSLLLIARIRLVPYERLCQV